jgi:hypothetical protein
VIVDAARIDILSIIFLYGLPIDVNSSADYFHRVARPADESFYLRHFRIKGVSENNDSREGCKGN